MEDLYPRRVWGFSTGCVLAPRSWTLDVASHHLFPTSAWRSEDAHHQRSSCGACNETLVVGGPQLETVDTLPLGSSANIARFESMAEGGATLYVTELFVPHHHYGESAPEVTSKDKNATMRQNCCTVEELRADLLRRHSWCSELRQAENTDGVARRSASLPMPPAPRAWVVEVSPRAVPASGLPSPSDSLSKSLLNTVQPFFRLFLEVVYDGGVGPQTDSPVVDGVVDEIEDAVHRILDHLVSLYSQPAFKLDALRHFSSRGVLCDSPSRTTGTALESVMRVSPQTCEAVEEVSANLQLRGPCSPLVVTAMGSEVVCPLMATCLYSEAGRSFFQLLCPRRHIGGIADGFEVDFLRRAEPKSFGSIHEAEGATPAVQLLLQRDLALEWENLTATTIVASAETVIAVAAFPLNSTDALPSSLYSFPSVERAWEAHVANLLNVRRRVQPQSDCGGASQLNRTDDFIVEWSLQKLSSSSPLQAEQLAGALRKAEALESSRYDPSLTQAERSMWKVAYDAGAPLLAPRSSSYLLRIVRGVAASPRPTVTTCIEEMESGNRPLLPDTTSDAPAHTSSPKEECYIVQLHAPRMLSTRAMVVGAAVPFPTAVEGPDSHTKTPSGGDAEGADEAACIAAAAKEWGSALYASYCFAPYAPSLWLPSERHGCGRSGLCARSGRLLLHVPIDSDRQYAGLHLLPVASNAFTTLGSIAVWIPPGSCTPSSQTGEARRSASAASGSSASVLERPYVVWTLIGDGRSARAYLEDALREFMYDVGTKTLLNVSQPSQQERQPGALVIRRKPPMWVETARTAHSTASSLVRRREVLSAWVDVGETRRVFLSVCEAGVGEVLLTESFLTGPHSVEQRSHGGQRRDVVETALEASSRVEAAALEDWITGITASALPQIL